MRKISGLRGVFFSTFIQSGIMPTPVPYAYSGGTVTTHTTAALPLRTRRVRPESFASPRRPSRGS
jgi:hypothetical protein